MLPTWGIAVSASFEIHSSTGPYSVSIEAGSFTRYLEQFPGAAILADEFFGPHLARLGTTATLIQAIEENKSLDAAPAYIERIRSFGANRQTQLLAVGGGIIQDLSAFIASIYMRGLSWSYVPTTILAMVDSCIGGKSSINVGPYKNLVGTFHPPQRILIDPDLAQTLPDDQKASGLIEAIKICFCHGAEAFDRHMATCPAVTMQTAALQALIINSLESKKWFIEIDEFDKNERLLLNFGHTFGHAIEGASHYGITHGIAVGIGILCALEFEGSRGADYSQTPRVQQLEDHLEQMVSQLPELKNYLAALPLDEVMERFASDKKHGTDYFTLVLVEPSGQVALRRLPKSAEIKQAVRNAVEVTIGRFI